MSLSILQEYGFKEAAVTLEPIGDGLINTTWKVIMPGKEFILQRLNESVFKEPTDIAHNIHLIADHLHRLHPGYPFVGPLASTSGLEMIYREGEGFFRLFPFVEGSHAKQVVQTPEQAWEAASQFGRLTQLLSDFDPSQLRIIIPSFHDLGLRYRQFLAALANGNNDRIRASQLLIKKLSSYTDIVTDFEKIRPANGFALRVTHHDTKISNVLFDDNDKGLCVIDLDTIMPGYFISDVGDMMRTYLSPVNEEEKDDSCIEVRDEFYRAIVMGYFNEMKEKLTEPEKMHFFYAGKCMIYMQAIRFLADYLNDDVYYKAKYPRHNYDRANNQAVLLQRLLEKESVLAHII